MDLADGGFSQAPFRHIDDALEGEVVGALRDDAEIGEGVADFLALVESRPADDAVIEAERDEPVLEFAHLERGAHEDGHIVEEMALALQLLDLLADGAGLFLRIPAGMDLDAVMIGVELFGEQGFAEAAVIEGDEMRGGAEYVFGGAVVALQLDDDRAGEILVEAQDIVHLRAAPAVDGLVVVADAADVYAPNLPPCGGGAALLRGGGGEFAAARTSPLRCLRRAPPPQGGRLKRAAATAAAATCIARRWCPDIHPPECSGTSGGIPCSTSGCVPEDRDRVHQEVAEIAGVEGFQALLIGAVQLAALAIAERAGVAFGDFGRAEALVLPAVDHDRELAGGPAFVVEAFGLDQLLDEADDVVGVENGEGGSEADQLGMSSKQFDANRMERAEPGHALDRLADQRRNALLHLAGGLVGEGDGEDLAREGFAGGQIYARCGWSARGSCRCPRPPEPEPGRRASRRRGAVRD